jgi:hypothetical protein
VCPNHEHSLDAGTLYWEHAGNGAIRCGDWKLVRTFPARELYNLRKDSTELDDVVAENRELAETLLADWAQWAADRKASCLSPNCLSPMSSEADRPAKPPVDDLKQVVAPVMPSSRSIRPDGATFFFRLLFAEYSYQGDQTRTAPPKSGSQLRVRLSGCGSGQCLPLEISIYKVLEGSSVQCIECVRYRYVFKCCRRFLRVPCRVRRSDHSWMVEEWVVGLRWFRL